jgi:hypothetical protein
LLLSLNATVSARLWEDELVPLSIRGYQPNEAVG